MEFVFYAIGITIAILGAVVWTIYQQVEGVDQHMYHQNAELKKHIHRLENDVDYLRRKLDDMQTSNEENEDE